FYCRPSGSHGRDIETPESDLFQDFFLRVLGGLLVTNHLRDSLASMTNEEPINATTFLLFSNCYAHFSRLSRVSFVGKFSGDHDWNDSRCNNVSGHSLQ